MGRKFTDGFVHSLVSPPKGGWQLSALKECIYSEDSVVFDVEGVPSEEQKQAARDWFSSDSTDHLQWGYRAWCQLGHKVGSAGAPKEGCGVPLVTPQLRGVRTNAHLAERISSNTTGLYLLSTAEMHALVTSNTFGPASQEDLDGLADCTEDRAPKDHASAWRTRLGTPETLMALAEASQAGDFWAAQRILSNGSSSAGTPSGWSYGDDFHLWLMLKYGGFGEPGFDKATLHNFLHGHGREDAIRVAYRIAMGAWAGETGMHLHLDVWRHHPAARRRGASHRDGLGLATRVAPSSVDLVPTLLSDAWKASASVGGRLPRLSADEWRSARNTDLWPEGHSHTSPDGLVYFPEGVHHNRACMSWSVSPKGLLEIKAPGYAPMRNRDRSYNTDSWMTAPINPPHLPVTYYVMQIMDQLEVMSSWPCGSADTQWADFVPQWIAHERSPPKPFVYRLDTQRCEATGGLLPDWARDSESEHCVWRKRWFTAETMHQRNIRYARQALYEQQLGAALHSRRHVKPRGLGVDANTHTKSQPLTSSTVATDNSDPDKGTARNKRILASPFPTKSRNTDLPSPPKTHVWLTGHSLVTRVRRCEPLIRAMMHDYYAYYVAARNKLHMKPLRMPKMRDPNSVSRAHTIGTSAASAVEEIKVTWVPIKEILWVVHPTPETPPVPSEWALSKFGPNPSETDVQHFTCPLDYANVDRGVVPEGWPVDTCPWPQGAWCTVFIVHFWDEQPRQSTMTELKEMK
jgi:hypothetical protein